MNTASIATLLAAGLATTAAAQNELTLEYTGRVVEITDERDLFPDVEAGQIYTGSITFDLGTTDTFADASILPVDLGFFEVPQINAEGNGRSFDGVEPFAFITNDGPAFTQSPLDPTISDSIYIQSLAFLDDGTNGNVIAEFVGGTDLFEDTGPDNAVELRFENLDRAEVTIEFSILDDFFSPNPTITRSFYVIQILEITNQGNTLTAPVCLPDTNENDEIDFG
ncbi:MAG: hypothetical protein AAFR96_12040, partial [Planctomycetota bacterium]